jgi:hypothetical protein
VDDGLTEVGLTAERRIHVQRIAIGGPLRELPDRFGRKLHQALASGDRNIGWSGTGC